MVLIFAVVKFTEGAWLVVVVGPILVFVLIRLNREYRAEDQVLENIGDRRAAGIAPRQPNYTRRVVLVLVDNIDLATLSALRYARSLRPTSLRAVHFVIDTSKANGLRERWVRFGQDIPFEMIDTPDRRVEHAAQELVRRETEQPGTQVTVVLPRRGFSPLIGRLLHDRTADKIAAAVSRIPNAAATIIPFDVQSRVRVLEARQEDRIVPVNGTDGGPRARRRRRGSQWGRCIAGGRSGHRDPAGHLTPGPAGASPAGAGLVGGAEDRVTGRAGQGHGRGPGHLPGHPARRAELRAGHRRVRRDRHADRAVLRAQADPRA